MLFVEPAATLCVCITLVYLFRAYFDYTKLITTPGLKQILGPLTFLPNENVLAKLFSRGFRFPAFGQLQFWVRKYDLYENGWDVRAIISIWPKVRTTLIVGDPVLFKEISTNRVVFQKPVDQYHPISILGRNIVASEGDEWRMYRKISAPAFSEQNNRLVWEEAIKSCSGFFEVWKRKGTLKGDQNREIITEDFRLCALKIGLHIIAAAGFGKHFSWDEDSDSPKTSGSRSSLGPRAQSHQMTLEETFHIVSEGFLIKAAVPDWIPGVTLSLRRVRIAFEELKYYLQEMINERKLEAASRPSPETTNANSAGNSGKAKADLFSNLLSANEPDSDSDEGEEEKNKLDEDQLIGNIYMFIVAGHETSAHTLSFAFGLLALYPDEQEKLWVQIMDVCQDRTPTYDDIPLLTRAMAIFNETLRLFPVVVGIPKYTVEDTVLTLTNIHDERLAIPVSKGTQIVLHTTGIHYNPRYWTNPYEFNPDRFLGDWPREAFVPFSSGPRSCIGKRFAEIESIAIIVEFIRRYKISTIPDPRDAQPEEDILKKRNRLLHAVNGLTLSPVRVPLVFTRRT